ncbi:unnamed protein product [Arctia plantaginis]|uniref:Secreted protein n=1 Tax=Arctia plantaginis TaxID=874455 RepID=A0A8S1AZF3_ARCPL|nr:unnamed protein product [Arctia plantaginis]
MFIKTCVVSLSALAGAVSRVVCMSPARFQRCTSYTPPLLYPPARRLGDERQVFTKPMLGTMLLVVAQRYNSERIEVF